MTTKVKLLHDTIGIPTGAVAVTQSASDNTTKVATTAYVTTALANLADSAPSTLNTLNELAAALGDDANFSTTVTNSIATKAPLATPQFTNRVGIGVAAHGTAGLNITSTAQHMRLNNGSELGIISLESDGALRLWSHGDSSNNEIEFYQGTGSGSPSMIINGSGSAFVEQGKSIGWRYQVSGTHRGSISCDSSDNITFANGSGATERMRIDTNGLVGLGSQITSNQASTYDARANDFVISGSGDTGMTIAGGGSENLRLQFTVNGDTGLNRGEINYDNNDNSFSFATAGSNRMGITGAGIVNINKPASGYGAGSNALNLYGDGEVFRIDGSGGASRSLRFRGVGTNGSSNAIIVSDGSLQLKNEDANAAMYFNSVRNMDFQVTSGNGTAGHMTFSSYNTEIMRIDGANDRVGIGYDSPGQKLQIAEATNYAPPGLGTNGGHFGIFKLDSGVPKYGMLTGVASSGKVWQQVQRIDGNATAYNLMLQPSGGNIEIGTSTNMGFLGQTNPNTPIHVGMSTTTAARMQITHENVGGFGALDIDSYGSATLRLISNFSGSTMNGVANGKFGLVTPHGRDIVIGTSGAERINISSSGHVTKINQPYIRCAGNSASMVQNQGTTADYANWANQVQRGITRSGAVFTVPTAGEYLITYCFYNWMNNTGKGVTHGVFLKKGSTSIQETNNEFDMGDNNYSYYDNHLSNSIVLNMAAGDTFKFTAYADMYGGTTHTTMSAYLLG